MNAMKENEIATCIRKAIGGYLTDLDGEKPGHLYSMVINSVEKPLIEIAIQHTNKNKRTTPAKLEFMKFDPKARKHVLYKEVKLK